MRAGFTVTFEDGSRDIVATLPDYFAWSKWSGKPIDEARGSIEDVVRLIHFADLRTGGTTLGFEDWAALIVDLDALDVVAPKATPKARGKGSSTNSK